VTLDGRSVTSAPARPAPAPRPGAGDVFAGTLLAALVRGEELGVAVARAVEEAAVWVAG
jgi:sugar/nucleoside kinase (ribokinase family)